MRFFHSETAVYLGQNEGDDLFFDCPEGIPTVVARYGGAPHDYRSGIYWAGFDISLKRAKELAVEYGLLSEQEIMDSTDLDDEISTCPDCLALMDSEEECEDVVCEYHFKELREHFDNVDPEGTETIH